MCIAHPYSWRYCVPYLFGRPQQSSWMCTNHWHQYIPVEPAWSCVEVLNCPHTCNPTFEGCGKMRLGFSQHNNRFKKMFTVPCAGRCQSPYCQWIFSRRNPIPRLQLCMYTRVLYPKDLGYTFEACRSKNENVILLYRTLRIQRYTGTTTKDQLWGNGEVSYSMTVPSIYCQPTVWFQAVKVQPQNVPDCQIQWVAQLWT